MILPSGDGCDIVNLCSLSVVPREVDVPEMTLVADLVEVIVVKPDSSVVCTDGGGLVSLRESVVRDTMLCSHDWHFSQVSFYLSSNQSIVRHTHMYNGISVEIKLESVVQKGLTDDDANQIYYDRI